ncbi:MAG: tetratricopeptide repeat protein [Myxococcales bacterium]|nr:tetratricopeptide repeat protein [Myxococcales bacterium]
MSQTVVLAGLIAFVTCLAYVGSLDGEFVSDDLQMVVPNPLLTSLDSQNLRNIFTSFDDANYMPLKVLSLAVDQALWGPEPLGYHVTNLLLHIGCALTIFSILLCLGFSRGAAFFVSLLWAVHPLQVESVAWISERKNLLSGLFFFVAFRAYLEFSERPRAITYVVTLLVYSLALLSKMNTLVLPAICLAFEATVKMRMRWRDLGATVPMFALGALTAWYNLAGSPTHGESFHGGSAVVTWLSSTVVVFRYLLHTVFPVGLTSRYDVPLWGSPFHPSVFASLLGLIMIAATTAWLVRHKKREVFWMLWFAIALAPMLNIVPFRSMMQDRYMYLALLGPIALAGSVLDRVSKPVARRAVGVAAFVVAIACVALTVRQVEFWSSPVSFWVRDATVRPLYANEAIYRPNEYPGKLAQLEAAVREEPDNPTLLNNLGGLYYMGGRVPEALGHFEKAHRLDPDELFNLINLGRAYMRLNRFEEAEPKLTRATELRPYNFMACYYLLHLHLETRDVTKARQTFDKCERLNDALQPEQDELRRLERLRM